MRKPGPPCLSSFKCVLQTICIDITWGCVLKFSFQGISPDPLTKKVGGRHLHFEQMSLAIVRDYDVGEPLPQTKLISLVNSCHSILSLLFQHSHHIQHVYYLCSRLDYKERSPKKHKSLLKHWWLVTNHFRKS